MYPVVEWFMSVMLLTNQGTELVVKNVMRSDMKVKAFHDIKEFGDASGWTHLRGGKIYSLRQSVSSSHRFRIPGSEREREIGKGGKSGGQTPVSRVHSQM